MTKKEKQTQSMFTAQDIKIFSPASEQTLISSDKNNWTQCYVFVNIECVIACCFCYLLILKQSLSIIFIAKQSILLLMPMAKSPIVFSSKDHTNQLAVGKRGRKTNCFENLIYRNESYLLLSPSYRLYHFNFDP